MLAERLTSGFLAAWLFLCAGALAAQTPANATSAAALEAELAEILSKPAARRAFWGVYAEDLQSGETLLDHNPDKLFIPASNAKLYSTALALARLGPEKQFRTIVAAESAVNSEGVLDGPLRLVGGGDPDLSSRVLPYNPKIEFRQDRMAPLAELARQIVSAGVRRVTGDIIGDDSRYVWDPHPDGWSIDDSLWSYGAAVSALSFNDNTLEVLVRPGAPGAPARLRRRPDIPYFDIRNKTATAAGRTVARRLTARRGADNPRVLELYGQISARSPGRNFEIAVDDPALFAAAAFKEALEQAGVVVEGVARARHLEPYDIPSLKNGTPPGDDAPGPALASIASAPLATLLTPLNKESVNLHAEMLLREVGYARRGVGSVQAGIEEMRDFLAESGLSRWEFFLEDGSGLSRRNLVTPSGTVKLLRRMWESDEREAFVETLAVGGVDGTLDWRFSRTAAQGRIRAKTGTLSHVTALSGYAETLDGRAAAFSVYVNNFGVSTSYIRKLVDEIVEALVRGP